MVNGEVDFELRRSSREEWRCKQQVVVTESHKGYLRESRGGMFI
jgi:hypothetical protein